jgi:hypothetical protein
MLTSRLLVQVVAAFLQLSGLQGPLSQTHVLASRIQNPLLTLHAVGSVITAALLQLSGRRTKAAGLRGPGGTMCGVQQQRLPRKLSQTSS